MCLHSRKMCTAAGSCHVRWWGFAILLVCFRLGIAQDDRFILRAPASSVPAIASRHNLTVGTYTDGHQITRVSKSDSRTKDQVLAEVAADPDVTGIESDRSVSVPELNAAAQISVNSSAVLNALSGRQLVNFFNAQAWNSYVNQPAAILIRLDDIQTSSYGAVTGTGIVAIIDTGVDPLQPLLKNSLVSGYDFVHLTAGIPSELSDLDQSTAAILDQSTAAILDKSTPAQVNQSTAAILDQSTAAILDTTKLPAAFGHGTMIAGIVHLAAPTAQIMPLKAFKGDGTAMLSDIVKAIYFAVDNGADIINMSFSLANPSTELVKAVNYATAHGVVCVASVGNDGAETIVFPAAFQNVIGVASTSLKDTRSVFSNFGAALTTLAAPGEGIVTTYPGGMYAVASGTSFSSPFVAGTVALMFSAKATLRPSDVPSGLSRAKRLSTDLGYGRIDAYMAVNSVRGD